MIKQVLALSISILFFTVCGQQPQSSLNRAKRSLIYPEGASRLQVITGFGFPVDYRSQMVIVGTVVKANYVLPMNSSQLVHPYIFYQRKKRSATRWDVYDLLSQALRTRGFGGKACILRAICEMAHTPLERNNGLFHELIHTLFTPSSTNEKVHRYSDSEYYAAQNMGKKNANCERIFQDCSASLVDMFTVYNDKTVL